MMVREAGFEPRALPAPHAITNAVDSPKLLASYWLASPIDLNSRTRGEL